MSIEVLSLRSIIDTIDARIIVLLGKRTKIARALWMVKQAEGLPVVDLKREREIIKRVKKLAHENKIYADEEIEAIYHHIIAISKGPGAG